MPDQLDALTSDPAAMGWMQGFPPAPAQRLHWAATDHMRFPTHRYAFSLMIEGEKGAIWTNRKYVAWRPKGSRFFRPMRNDKVPRGDEQSYPQGGTTSLLNSLRDAVRHGTSAATRGDDNIWTVAMVEAGKLSDQERRTVDIAEVYQGLSAR